MNFIEELKWRNMLMDSTPGIEDLFNQGPVVGLYRLRPDCTFPYNRQHGSGYAAFSFSTYRQQANRADGRSNRNDR